MQLPLPTSDQALPGRDIPVQVSDLHFVNGNRIKPPFEDDIEINTPYCNSSFGHNWNDGTKCICATI